MNNNLIPAINSNYDMEISTNDNRARTSTILTPTDNITNVTLKNKTRQIHKPLFSTDTYKLINHFLKGNDITSLTYNQLIQLSKIYEFSKADLISLKHNPDFFEYLHKNNIRAFDTLPQALQQDVAIAKKAFLAGNQSFIQYIPAEHQTPEIYQKFLKYFYSTELHDCYLEYLSEDLQTSAMWDTVLTSKLFSSREYSLKKIPDKFKTKYICEEIYKICLYDDFSIFKEKFKTFDLCKEYLYIALKIDLNLIPKQFINKLQNILITRLETDIINGRYRPLEELKGIEILPITLLKENPDIIVKACTSDPESIKKIDASLITNEIVNAIASKNISALPKKYIPDYLTKEQCLTYIEKEQGDYEYLPDQYKFNIDIILYMLNKNINNIETLNSPYLDQQQYQQIFENFPATPSWKLNINSYKNHIQQKIQLINTIPKESRSLDIWIYLCNNSSRELITEIPEQLITKASFSYLVDEYIRRGSAMDITFMENLFCHKLFDENIRIKILKHSLQCCSRSSSIVFSLMQASGIPLDFKQQLWKNIQVGNFLFSPAIPEDLYKKDNPIQRAIATTFAPDFLTSCYKFSNYTELSLPRVGQALKEYMNILSKIEELPLDINNNNFTDAKVTGGRTIQVDISSTEAMFYKFRKKGEELNSFIKEGVYFEFLHTNTQGKELKKLLKSEIPTLKKLVRIPIEKLPECAFKCEDGIDIFQDSQENKFVDVLVFVTAKDYLKYAHMTDIENPDKPFAKGEQGLLKAIYDIGVFASKGIYYTSTLPAYHFYKEKRLWSPLHMLMRRMHLDFISGEIMYPVRTEITMTGKLEKWNTTATERPDYGYTGLRDFADCEFFGEITSVLSRAGAKNLKMFPLIIQNIVAANTICECLIASILLYARLHHKSPYYHYKNETCKKQTAEFIEKLFTNFLAGRLQQENIKLQDFMQLTAEQYKKWLDRAVTELLYWTAKNHSSSSIKMEEEILDIDFNDHVEVHVKNRKLPEDLYEHYDMLDNSKFTLLYNHTNLGLVNATFPLLALTNFMFLLNSKLKENSI